MSIGKFNLIRMTALSAAFVAIMGLSLSGAKAHKYHGHFDPGAFIAGAVIGAIISHGHYHHHHHKKYRKRAKRRHYRTRKIRRCHRHRCGPEFRIIRHRHYRRY